MRELWEINKTGRRVSRWKVETHRGLHRTEEEACEENEIGIEEEQALDIRQ